jgi:hypothetical protein
MNLRYSIAAGIGISAVILFSAFGGEKMTQAEQLKNIETVISEKMADFETAKRAECKAMALQRAVSVAEERLAADTKTPAAPAKPTTKATTTKTPTKTKPTPAPKVQPAPTPAPSQPNQPTQKTRTGATNIEATPAEQKTRGGATKMDATPAEQKTRGGAIKVDENKGGN